MFAVRGLRYETAHPERVAKLTLTAGHQIIYPQVCGEPHGDWGFKDDGSLEISFNDQGSSNLMRYKLRPVKHTSCFAEWDDELKLLIPWSSESD